MSSEFRIIRQPFITEKSSVLKDDASVLSLEVAINATKADVKRAVERVFKVKVMSVNMLRLKGKLKRRGRHEGRRPERKKAFVRLMPGETTPEFFE